jgi:hypothetical protein
MSGRSGAGHAPATAVETTFEWRDLRFHVLTRDPPTDAQLAFLRQVLSRVDRVGLFADALGYTFGRHVQIRTTRPSPDIWFDVGI